MTYPEAASENFYEGLEAVVSAFPLSDMLILLGDFNARVGRDHQAWEVVISHLGVVKCNNTCAANGFAITNTMICLPNRKKTS